MTLVSSTPRQPQGPDGPRLSGPCLTMTRPHFLNSWVQRASPFSFHALQLRLRRVGKIATAPSANIFTNREYELLLQSLSLRRLSYVIFTGDKNHFLTQLPSIVEKLVDILRNVPSAVVQSEVYLCTRVLLCRLSPHNLTSYWPVILTEMVRCRLSFDCRCLIRFAVLRSSVSAL